MRDAHHELRMEPRAGLELALSLVTALLSVLSHMQEAHDITTPRAFHPHNKPPRRPASEGNGSVKTSGPAALVNLRIDAEREYAVDEVAELLGISPQTVRKNIDNKKLAGERRGKGRGHWIIQGTELLRFTHQTDDQQS